MHYLRSIIILCGLVLCTCRVAFPANTFRIIRDPEERLTIREVVRQAPAVPTSTFISKVSEGFYPGAVWLILDEPFPTAEFLLIDNPLLAKVDYFLANDTIITKAVHAGYSRPFKQRDVAFPGFVFRLPDHHDNCTRIVLRIAGPDVMSADLHFASRAYLNSFFFKTSAVSLSISGALIALFLFYLIIFYSLRDRIYVYYLVYSFFVIVTVLRINGFWDFVFSGIALYISPYTAFFDAFPAITTGLFSLQFLRIREYSTILFRVFLVLLGVQGGMLLVSLAGYNQAALIGTGFITGAFFMPLTLGIGVWVWYKKKYSPAKYYLISVFILYSSGMVSIAKVNGLISSESLFITHAIELGMAAEMLLLAIAVSQRFEALRIDKETVQAENLRMVSVQAEVLEQQVAERTHTLREQASELQRQKEAIDSINARLEETVVQRTRQLVHQNEHLREYAFLNSHKVRGPLARILGIVEIWRLQKITSEDALTWIDASAGELDGVITQMNAALEVDTSDLPPDDLTSLPPKT